jgi:hypothetical protein
MKVLLISFVVLYFNLSQSGFAQVEASPDFIIKTPNDTVFCTDLVYVFNTRGNLSQLRYISLDGVPYRFKGKNNVPSIETIFIKGKLLDKIPYKAQTRTKMYVYSERLVDGEIKVYIDQQIPDQSVVYRFYVKLNGSGFYRVNNKSDFENVIRPFFMRCKSFSAQYSQKDFQTEEAFLEAANFYNLNCSSAPIEQ